MPTVYLSPQLTLFTTCCRIALESQVHCPKCNTPISPQGHQARMRHAILTSKKAQ